MKKKSLRKINLKKNSIAKLEKTHSIKGGTRTLKDPSAAMSNCAGTTCLL